MVDALKEGGRGGGTGGARSLVRSALVVAQIAIGLILLVSSGLMVRSFQALRNVEPGFTDPDTVLTVRVGIPSAEVDDLEVLQIQQRIIEGIAALPGVASVAGTWSLPVSQVQSSDALLTEGQEVPPGSMPPIRRFKFITPDYFQTIGNPLIVGRDLTWLDLEEHRPVAIVTADLAHETWGSVDEALGKRIAGSVSDESEPIWREVIGVVGSVHDDGPSEATVPIVYWPNAMNGFWGTELFIQRSLSYTIRTERVSDPGFLKELQAIVWEQNPNLPIGNVGTLAAIYDRSMARASFAMLMLLIAALMALVIGSVGIYGVISYIVSQRTREFGVRLALGATAREVNGMVIRYGMTLAAIGLALGLVASSLITSLLSSLLFGVEARDPATFGLVAVVLSIVALAATTMAGRRASKVDPVKALRAD